jgi:hypothetical protein
MNIIIIIIICFIIFKINLFKCTIIKNIQLKKESFKTNYNILIIGNIKRFRSELSRNRVEFLYYLNKYNNIKIIGPGETNDIYYDDIDINLLIDKLYGINKPDYIIHYITTSHEPYNKILVSNFNKCKIPTSLWVEDIYHIDFCCNLVKHNNINNIIFSIRNNKIYQNMNMLCPYVKYKFNFHFINTNIYKDYKLPKIYDILLYGSIEKKIYPFRNRLYYLLKNNTSRFNVKIIEYTNYLLIKGDKYTKGKDLAKLINQSYICIATKSIHNLFVKKYLEIPACNSVICGDIPSDYENLLKDNMIEINDKMSDDKILNILEENLKNKEGLMKYSLFGEYVRNNFNFQKGYEHLMKIMN